MRSESKYFENWFWLFTCHVYPIRNVVRQAVHIRGNSKSFSTYPKRKMISSLKSPLHLHPLFTVRFGCRCNSNQTPCWIIIIVNLENLDLKIIRICVTQWFDPFFSKPVAFQMIHISCTHCECILYNTVTYLAASSRLSLDSSEALPANGGPCKDRIICFYFASVPDYVQHTP